MGQPAVPHPVESLQQQQQVQQPEQPEQQQPEPQVQQPIVKNFEPSTPGIPVASRVGKFKQAVKKVIDMNHTKKISDSGILLGILENYVHLIPNENDIKDKQQELTKELDSIKALNESI